MKWQIDFSPDSLKFLRKNDIKEIFVIGKIKLAIRKFRGENINIDIKRLKGKWKTFHRIRFGKVRIILEFQFSRSRVYIERIDWRGNVYR